jgi:hypothetical protein
LLALYTARALREQREATAAQIEEQQKIAQTQLKVGLHMSMEDRFDSPSMQAARARLARLILENASEDDYPETVPDYFESLGILDRLGYLFDDLTWNSFSVYAIHWWGALKTYVRNIRRDDSDSTSYEEFEKLADKMLNEEARRRNLTRSGVEPSPDDVRDFLQDERDTVAERP